MTVETPPTVQIVINTDICRFRNLPLPMSRRFASTFRYLSDKANGYNTAFTSGRWDGYVRLYRMADQSLPTGLLGKAVTLLKQHGYAVSYDDKRPVPAAPFVVMAGIAPQLRWYQQEAVTAALTRKRGQIEAPTGAGKTVIAQQIITETGVGRHLFAVPSTILLNQTVKRFKEAFTNVEVYQWGDKLAQHPDPDKPFILVTTYQTLGKRHADPLLKTVEALHLDECHRVAAEYFKQGATSCTNARFIFGYSATPFRDSNDGLELDAWIGSVIYRVDMERLIQEGYIVPPAFEAVPTFEQAMERVQGRKAILFTEKLETLEQKRHLIEANNGFVFHSKTPKKQEVLKALETGELTFIATTPTMDEGLDMPTLDTVMFYNTYKVKGRIIQRIGRALRPYPGKTSALILDIVDESYFNRLDVYKSIPSFARRLK